MQFIFVQCFVVVMNYVLLYEVYSQVSIHISFSLQILLLVWDV